MKSLSIAAATFAGGAAHAEVVAISTATGVGPVSIDLGGGLLALMLGGSGAIARRRRA